MRKGLEKFCQRLPKFAPEKRVGSEGERRRRFVAPPSHSVCQQGGEREARISQREGGRREEGSSNGGCGGSRVSALESWFVRPLFPHSIGQDEIEVKWDASVYKRPPSWLFQATPRYS